MIPTVSKPATGRPTTWTLRTKLVVSVVVLMAVTLMAIGTLIVAGVDRYLVSQLDQQLQSLAGRSQNALSGGLRANGNTLLPPPNDGNILIRGQATGTIGALAVNGSVVRAVEVNEYGQPIELQPSELSTLAAVPANAAPVTWEVDGLGDYRVLATRTPEGLTRVTGIPLAPVTAAVSQIALIIVVVTLVGLVAAGVAAAFIVRLSLTPLRRVAATASQVAATPLDSGDVALSVRVPSADTNPHTEVGQVGLAINHMLANVSAALTARHQSETKLRNFVADASHELRTPLASIRGYAELAEKSAGEVPPDVARSISRIDSESIRMTGLVEDLLLLARLDAGRPLAIAPVDLSQLLVKVVSDAHAAGPDHQWNLQLPDDPVVVNGDEQRLHQVLANVLSNARLHTPTGTCVTTQLEAARGEQSSGMVKITISDNGPGIPPELVPEIFDRFSRGDASRSRLGGGTGLGMAIAAAIVAAHHGTIAVQSEPGNTMFTIGIP